MRKREKKSANPLENIPSGVRIMIISQGRSLSVWVEGAQRLLLCLGHSVRILLKNEILCLYGNGLLCMTYASGAIEVKGNVEELKFEPSSCIREKE